MIDGFANLIDGKTDKGIAHLEKARELVPNDVIIQAMLAEAYLTSGNWEGYAGLPVTRELVEAHTAYEKIFVGQALCWTDPKRSLKLLDEAIESTRTPLAFVYRARTRACIANVEKDHSLARKALHDASMSEFLPNHSMAQSIQLTMQLTVYDVLNFLSKSSDGTVAEELAAEAAEVLRLAGKNADSLESLALTQEFSISPEALLALGMYHQACGDDNKALEYFMRTSLGKSRVFAYAFHPDRTKAEMEAAEKILQSAPFGSGRSHVYRCLLLFELGCPDKANEIIDKMLVEAKDKGWVIDLAMAGGRLETAKQQAQRLLAKFPDDAIGIRVEYLKFFAGDYDGDVDEYLSQCNVIDISAKNYHVGMRLLFSGDPENARKFLKQAESTGLPVDSNRFKASALLRRMDTPGKLDWVSRK